MGYFSNGTEGLDFDEKWCSRCVHLPKRQDRGCPVMLAHLLFAYELCNEKKHPGKVILDILIERDEATGAQRCTMFVDKTKPLRVAVDVERDEEMTRARLADVKAGRW